jgi:hypothetical protein
MGGGLVTMRSAHAGKACANMAGVMVPASMGSRDSLCIVPVCASGSMSAHVYEATSWPALRIASSLVVMPPQSSTKWMGLWGRVCLGMFASGAGEGWSLVEGRSVFVALGGGVVEETNVAQTGKGRVGRAEEEVSGGPSLACEFGKNVSCSSDIWQVLRRAEVRSWPMRSMHTNWSLPSLMEMRTSSTGHLAGGREDISPSVCL